MRAIEVTSVGRIGSPVLPTGRFVSATTDTALGPIQLVGVSIPWSRAHVASGRRDRRPWDDHITFLEGLAPMLASETVQPRITLGDINQSSSRISQPERVFEALSRAGTPVPHGHGRVTDHAGQAAVGHLAHTRGLAAQVVAELPSRDASGLALSDHFGLVLDVWRSE